MDRSSGDTPQPKKSLNEREDHACENEKPGVQLNTLVHTLSVSMRWVLPTPVRLSEGFSFVLPASLFNYHCPGG